KIYENTNPSDFFQHIPSETLINPSSIPNLMQNNLIISSQKNLSKLKNIIAAKGKETFHVLSDFDNTLISAFVDGKKVRSIIAQLRDGNYLTKDYASKANALFEKYHPIEISQKVPLEEKTKAMREWWTTHFDLLISSGLNKKDLKKVVESGKVRLRKGAREFLGFLHKNNIPLIILSSSGIGDAIPMYLKKEKVLYDNTHIISNFYEWGSNGNAVKVKEPIIHCMNKHEIIIKNYPVFNIIKKRKNVLLLGDSIGDIGMIQGFAYNHLLKIGFLNEEITKNLENYKESFDILIPNDGGMDYVNKILKEMF
ncbi:MAG: hypothetical protein KKG60_02305, partial [Nanoarchaeota archaeon]|nr:hypothetical protein [Nanoarchaeota archaeon]